MDKVENLYMYMIFFIISSIILGISQKVKDRIVSKCLIVISAIIPIIISGFRYGVGTDYWSYVDIYNNINSGLSLAYLTNMYEVFHIFLCKVIYLINDNSQYVFLAYSLLTVTFVYKAILNQVETKKNILYILAMYLLAIFPFSFNGVRQALAVVIMLYGYKYLVNYNIKKYLLINIFAMAVHMSSIIVFPFGVLWLLLKNRRDKKIIIVVTYIFIYISILYLPNILPNEGIYSKIFAYYSNNSSINFGLGLVAMRIPFYLFILINLKKLREINKSNDMYICMVFINIILLYLGYLNIYLNRLALYFSITEIFLIPSFIQVPEKKNAQNLLKVIIFIFIIYQFVYNYYICGSADIFPYQININ